MIWDMKESPMDTGHIHYSDTIICLDSVSIIGVHQRELKVTLRDGDSFQFGIS